MKCSKCGCSVIELFIMNNHEYYECTNCGHHWELDLAMIEEITELIRKVEHANDKTGPDTAIL